MEGTGVSNGADPATYTYSYTVTNNSNDYINKVILPIFSTSDVSGAIKSPVGWSGEVVATDDRWRTTYTNGSAAMRSNPNYGPNAETAFANPPFMLVWTYTGLVAAGDTALVVPLDPPPMGGGIPPNSSLNGFKFDSLFAGKPAPFVAGFAESPSYLGDPDTPNSPARQIAQADPVLGTPEPATMLLFAALGTVAVVYGRRARLAPVAA